VLAIARRVADERPEAGDADRLKHAAAAGDARAIELLAWCALKGIGMDRDPIAAYLLYGKAAAAAVPQARENQRLIYERTLSSAQRQLVLDVAAMSRRTPGTLAAGAPEGGTANVR
jgi:TPR repeat protein